MMKEIFYMIYSIIIPLFVLFGPKGVLVLNVVSGAEGRKLKPLDAVNCFIPYYNNYRLRKALYGGAPVFKLINWIAIVTALCVAVIRFVLPLTSIPDGIHQLIQVALSLWLVFFITITYVVEIYIHWDLCNTFAKKGLIITTLLPPIAASLLTPHISPYFKKYRARLDGTFNGNSTK